MYELFDDIIELVYIADIETYELLYVNKLGRKSFQIEENNQKKCYEVFQGADSPCSFCTNSRLKQGEVYAWQKTNPITGRTYMLRDSLVDWNGKIARIEMAMDITKQFIEKEELRHALDAEKMVLQCVRQLHDKKENGKGISNMLELLGRELCAERSYIFDIHGEVMSNTYEWCAEGIESQKDFLQDVSVTLMDRWRVNFDKDECVIIESLEEIAEQFPSEYEALHKQGIYVLVAAPLKEEDELVGFIGVDNPLVEKIQNIAILFNTLSYYVMNARRNILEEKVLEKLSFCDTLTGLYNRNRYILDMEEIKSRDVTALGVLFMDLNGLKRINDNGGHAKGDEALIKCSELLRMVFPKATLYRIGGDEFVAMETQTPKDQFFEQVRLLHIQFEHSEYKVAIGTKWTDNSLQVEYMMQCADEDMYKDKRRFYRTDKEHMKNDNESFSRENPLLKEYNMLMSSMHISVSKHLAQEDFHVEWANDYFYELLKYSKEEFENIFHNSIKEYFAKDEEDFRSLIDVVMGAFSQGHSGYETILHVPQKDGTYIWINLVGIFTEEQINGVPVIYTVFTNVSDAIHMQKEQMITYDALPGFVAKVIITKDGLRLLYGNQKFSSFFGEHTEEKPSKVLMKNLVMNKDTIKKYCSEISKGEDISFFMDAQDTKDNLSNFQIFASCIDKINGNPVYFVLFIDVTEITFQQKRLKDIAFIDSVTGGKNRTCFEIEAGRAIALEEAYHYVLVYADIQKFKVINDLFGIEAGNQTLRYVYHTMEAHLKEGEYAARLSSDNFNLLLKADTSENIVARLQELAKDINRFNENIAHKYILVLAAGIYMIDDPTTPIIQIQDRANTARKKNKMNPSTNLCLCQFYNNEDSLLMQREKEIENIMQDALRQEQFIVYIQPKMSSNGKVVVGGEALIRWQHPQRGLLPPDYFIPLFEKNGFIVDIDFYVFEFVCKKIRLWLDLGLTPVPISVNMSRAHLVNGNFQKNYERIRKKYQVPSYLLEIEITETLVNENPQLLSKVIDEFRKYGYLCSLDDFGSGQSSLNVLKDIYIDVLKIDGAFFSPNLLNNPRESAIVDIVIELAKRLHIKVVAEGVETVEQAQFLEKAGCHILQGYLFSKPVPVDIFEKIVYGMDNEK